MKNHSCNLQQYARWNMGQDSTVVQLKAQHWTVSSVQSGAFGDIMQIDIVLFGTIHIRFDLTRVDFTTILYALYLLWSSL